MLNQRGEMMGKKKDDFKSGWDAAWKFIFGDEYSTKKVVAPYQGMIPKWRFDMTRIRPKK